MKTNKRSEEFVTVASQIRGVLDKINRTICNLEDHFNSDSLTQADINALLKIRFDLAQTADAISDRLGIRE